MKKIMLLCLLLATFATSCDTMVVSDVARIKTIEAQFPRSKVVINHTDRNTFYYAIDTAGGEIHSYQIEFYINSDKIKNIQNL